MNDPTLFYGPHDISSDDRPVVQML